MHIIMKEIPRLSLSARWYNINEGYSRNIISKCSVLREYMLFVNIIRENIINGIESPVEEAINYCINNHILEKFLESRGNEVLKIMTIDMTFERREQLIRKEEQKEGLIL